MPCEQFLHLKAYTDVALVQEVILEWTVLEIVEGVVHIEEQPPAKEQVQPDRSAKSNTTKLIFHLGVTFEPGYL